MSSDPDIVVYFAHLAIETSVINRAMCDAIRDLPNVNFRDLHELYPLSLIHISEPTRQLMSSRMPSSA